MDGLITPKPVLHLGYTYDDTTPNRPAHGIKAPRLSSSISAPATLSVAAEEHPLARYNRESLQHRIYRLEEDLFDLEMQHMEAERYIRAKKESIQEIRDFLQLVASSRDDEIGFGEPSSQQSLSPQNKGKQRER